MRDGPVKDSASLSLVHDTGRRQGATDTRFFELTVDMLAVGSIRDGRCKRANPAVIEVLGWSESELLAMSFVDLVHPDDLPRSRVALAGLAAGEVTRFEHRVRCRDGAYKWIAWNTAVDLAAGLIFCAGRDVTATRAAESALHESKAAADAANRAKSEFLANMSHELRTPMNAILGMTELALREPLTPTLSDFLRTVKESGELLLGLLNQVLDFSRIEAGQMELDRVPFRLRKAVMQVARTLAPRANEKDLELILDVADEVPDAVVGDPLRLRQILFNLVGNAIKFTEVGEITISIRLANAAANAGADPVGDVVAVEFAICDTGVGIASAVKDQIFAPFAQADASTSRRYGGSGLGLAIVHSLVAMMGGKIDVESQPGRGSTFTFTVRLGRDRDASDEPAALSGRRDALRGVRILVVGESSTHRRMLQRTVAAWGMEAETARDAPQALAALHAAVAAERPFAICLCEAELAKIDGFTLAEWLRRDRALARAVILMLSPSERQGQKERCRTLGAGWVDKPVSPSDLLDAITRGLDLEGVPRADSPERRHRPATRSLRILVAEDTPANQKLVTYLLRGRGHAVEIAGDGQKAVDRAAREDFDLILMDVQMPILDGIAATRAIRALDDPRRARTPIVAITAHALRGDAERTLDAGMDAYLSKPIAGDELIEVVERLAAPAEASDDAAASPAEVDVDAAIRICFGDREMFRDMIECLHDESDRLLAELRVAVGDGDAGAVHRGAHRLKNTVIYLGAAAAEEATERVLQLGLAGDLRGAPAALDGLAAALERLKAALAPHRR